jgi:hypothetical protein
MNNVSFIPQIWTDALIEQCKRDLETISPWLEFMKEWDREHAIRMKEDPEYARKHEEFEREWEEMLENYNEEDNHE